MKQSIESIWQQGFIDKNALIAPKVNNLYDKKSQSIIDKLCRKIVIYLYAATAGAIILFAAFSLRGEYYFGGFICIIGILSVVLGRKQLKGLQKIDKNVSSYQYIKSFDGLFKKHIEENKKISTYVYPIVFLAVMIHLRPTWIGQHVINDLISYFPNSFLIAGVPWFVLLGIAIIAGLLTYFSGTIFRMEVNSIYGREIKKLDEIIADMEELRK